MGVGDFVLLVEFMNDERPDGDWEDPNIKCGKANMKMAAEDTSVAPAKSLGLFEYLQKWLKTITVAKYPMLSTFLMKPVAELDMPNALSISVMTDE